MPQVYPLKQKLSTSWFQFVGLIFSGVKMEVIEPASLVHREVKNRGYDLLLLTSGPKSSKFPRLFLWPGSL